MLYHSTYYLLPTCSSVLLGRRKRSSESGEAQRVSLALEKLYALVQCVLQPSISSSAFSTFSMSEMRVNMPRRVESGNARIPGVETKSVEMKPVSSAS